MDDVWAEVKEAVDEYLAKEEAPAAVRNAMALILDRRPFDAYSVSPMAAVANAFAAEFRTLPFLFLYAAELEPVVMGILARTIAPSPQDLVDISELQSFFRAPFQGASHERLFRHVMNCRALCLQFPVTFVFPCFAIVQSSGFGKSRLVRELAATIARREYAKGNLAMHVVYVCMRDRRSASAFPPATPELCNHLFPDDGGSEAIKQKTLTDKLVTLFEVVMTVQWESMNESLTRRFEGDDAGLTAQLRGDEGGAITLDETQRMLVLVVDEARALLPSSEDAKIGWFRILHRALRDANTMLFKRYGVASLLMAIFMDSDSRVAKFVPTVQVCRLLDPFVLTDTMDLVFAGGALDKATRYKELVVQAATSNGPSWQTLLQFGRPLWALGLPTHYTHDADRLFGFAAQQLLGGSRLGELNAHNYYGVAALLCRLGLRPYSTTTLASRVVADLMAVLSYVSYKHDQIISSYSSDPVLTLGAAYLWHQNPENFASHMLPELRRLLIEETLDTAGHEGEVVARILLLLVMDASAVVEKQDECARWASVGSFVSVWMFLRVLQGDNPSLHVVPHDQLDAAYAKARHQRPPVDVKQSKQPRREHDTDATTTTRRDGEPEKPRRIASTGAILSSALDELESRWTPCRMSFTHFVQLENEPTEACLWAMLARRAAGLFPRGCKGVHLVIPVFVPDPISVTMILVQVTNGQDAPFPGSATFGTRPVYCFNPSNSLQDLWSAHVVRVHMNLRERKQSSRVYVRDDHDESEGGGHSYVLCVQSIDRWTTSYTTEASATRVEVPVVSEQVAEALASMARPWWTVVERVGQGVRDMEATVEQETRQVMFDEATMYARLPLAENLLLNGQDEEEE